MVKSKSVWAQIGRGAKVRDTEHPGAPVRVTEDAQASNIINEQTANLLELTHPPVERKRDLLPERPRTSAGPATTFARRKHAERRETKDDLHFNPLTSHGRGSTFYNFPLQETLPRPAASPKLLQRSATFTPQLISPPTAEHLDLTTASMTVPEDIGMALGSPQHPPMAWPQIPDERYTPSPDQSDSTVEAFSNSPSALKTKSSKWKLLGGLFGGKKQESPIAFYQVQPEPTNGGLSNYSSDFGEPSATTDNPVKPRMQGRTTSQRNKWRTKPDVKRSQTTPLPFITQDPGRNEYSQTPQITIDRGQVVYDGSRNGSKGTGLLDVDIPSIQMERYSVMFGALLQKPQTTPSSLLLRRQATLDKLKTANETVATEEREPKFMLPRRATSPRMTTPSPAFSLFPSTPRQQDISPSRAMLAVRLQRSNTSPAVLSPSRPSFASNLHNEIHADSPTMPEFEASETQARQTRPIIPERKDSRPTLDRSAVPRQGRWSPEESRLALDSGSDNEDDNEYTVESPIAVSVFSKPRLVEPHWQMVPPLQPLQADEPSSSGSGSAHSTSTSASSITTSLNGGTAYNSVAKPLMSHPPQTRMRAGTTAQNAPPKPPTARSRSATTIVPSSSIPRPSPIPTTSTSSPMSPKDHKEKEARLESAAGVSIARQISVSRQQRQLLVPKPRPGLKTSSPGLSKTFIGDPSSARSPNTERVIGAQNFPSPASGIKIVTVVKAASSPLSAIAQATREEHERAGSPMVDQDFGRLSSPNGRFGQVAKPSTPTIVMVGGYFDGEEEIRAAAAANGAGIAERRKIRELDRARDAQANTQIVSEVRAGGIKGGLAIPRDSSPARQMQNRKSERVVVERMSVESVQ